MQSADVLFIHNASLANLSRWSGKPVCLISHSGKLRYLGAADHAIFLSKAAAARAQDLADTGRTGTTELHVIPHGFPAYDIVPSPDSAGDQLRIMAAGRFVPKKGFETLLEAAHILRDHTPSMHFDIYGDGPLKPVLTTMIDQLDLDNVSLHGWTPALDQAFAAADIFCLPSLEEPFGLVIGEAMGRGIPMVATCTDGPLDVLGFDGIQRDQTLPAGGLLTEPGDADSLAKALASLSDSRGMLASTGEAARRRIVADFGMEALADRLDRLISMASQPQPAAPW